ncbi:MAG TPA: hypothetical protein VIF10_14420 [Methylobacter sp.]
MTDLTKLSVSLTKHGAHKIALLLDKYDKDEVLDHLWGTDEGINIESVQAYKNLSVTADGKVPDVWNKVRNAGPDAIDALVLIAIIFSHHDLIAAMKAGAGSLPLTGTIIRGKQLEGKAFTNFAHTIEQLGFSTEHSKNHVSYNLQKIFDIEGFNGFALELLNLKLTAAGWDKKNNLTDEFIQNEFHQVFALNKERFFEWISSGSLPSEKLLEDATFFLATDEIEKSTPFKFSAGHNEKKIGKVTVSASSSDGIATLLHNDIQNKLYAKFVAEHGEKCVGTEVPTGQGTSIDLVVKTEKFCWFYEIKTATSAKACIRQAIPQLLEYAYWDCTTHKVDSLIVVGPVPLTDEASKYLEFLRKMFSIPIYYEFYNAEAS